MTLRIVAQHTVYVLIAAARASGLEARLRPLQGHAASQRALVWCVGLGLRVLQLPILPDIASAGSVDVRCNARKGRARSPGLSCTASGKDEQMSAAAGAASGQHSTQIGRDRRGSSLERDRCDVLTAVMSTSHCMRA